MTAQGQCGLSTSLLGVTASARSRRRGGCRRRQPIPTPDLRVLHRDTGEGPNAVVRSSSEISNHESLTALDVAKLRQAQLTVYPYVHHAFDVAQLQPGRSFCPAIARIQRSAAKDAEEKTRASLAANIGVLLAKAVPSKENAGAHPS
jgi:hypothetical protein